MTCRGAGETEGGASARAIREGQTCNQGTTDTMWTRAAAEAAHLHVHRRRRCRRRRTEPGLGRLGRLARAGSGCCAIRVTRLSALTICPHVRSRLLRL
jgi:hypothetical protein